MSQRVSGGWAHKALAACAAGVAVHFAAPAAFAQTAPAGTAADGAPSEAARRAAMSPYRFILAAPPRRAPAPAPEAKPEPKPEPRPAPETKRQEPAPLQSAARTAPPSPVPMAAPVPAPEAAPAPQPAPMPEAVAARARTVEPPPVRREIVPVRIDEPRLPAALMRERPNGLVKVQFEIHPDGSTKDVKVLASTNRSLNRHTVDAVADWKFQPVDEILTIETEIAYKYD